MLGGGLFEKHTWGASRKTKDQSRDVLVEMVKYQKKPYQGPKNTGGYVFDRDSLWNDFFLAVPEYKKIIMYRRITSLEELEVRALTWRAEQFSKSISLDEMIGSGIEPGYDRYTYNGQRRDIHKRYDR